MQKGCGRTGVCKQENKVCAQKACLHAIDLDNLCLLNFEAEHIVCEGKKEIFAYL